LATWKFANLRTSGFGWTAVAALAFLALQVPLSDYLVDDTFIHLTFARNLSRGAGFAFNPGEPTYGVTAPLWTLILTLFSVVFPPGPLPAKTLSIIFGLLTIPAFRRLAGGIGLSAPSANAVTLVWAVNVWLVRWGASGMEAGLAVLLLLLAFDAQVQRRSIAGLWLGLVFLCRPEVGVLGVIFFLDRLSSDGWRPALVMAGFGAVVVLPWLVYAQSSFGTVVPNPALVKSDMGLPLLEDFLLGLKRTALIIGGSNGIEVLVLLAGLGFITRRRFVLSGETVRRGGLLFIWAIFPALVYLSRGVFISSRYLLIGIPPLTLGAFFLLDVFASGSGARVWGRMRTVIAAVMIVQQLTLTYSVTLPHIRAFMPTIEALTRMAELLHRESPLEAAVAVGDVGVIGFYSERYVVDLEGLVTPQMIPYRVGRPLDDLVTSERYFQVKRPDYLIDKSRLPGRLADGADDRYQVISIEPVPGGLVDTAHEQWYYTLYRIEPSVDGSDEEKR